MDRLFRMIFAATVVMVSDSPATGVDGTTYLKGIQEALEAGRDRFAFSQALRAGDRLAKIEGATAVLDRVAVAVVPVGKRTLKPMEAAFHAARTANDECERVFGERPYAWWHHLPVRSKQGWTWGRMDVAGVNGHSTVVRMRADGTVPDCTVYFSEDGINPKVQILVPRNKK